MKKCRDCKLFLPISSFYPHTTTKDNLRPECKKCYCKRRIIYNKTSIVYKEYQKEWQKNERKNNPQFKLAFSLRRRICTALQCNWKSGSAVKDLGCSIQELKIYLENKFQEGMSWNNHGKWHIDHIQPLSKFNLTNREEFLKACNFTNLQPLWAHDNLTKSNKIL